MEDKEEQVRAFRKALQTDEDINIKTKYERKKELENKENRTTEEEMELFEICLEG